MIFEFTALDTNLKLACFPARSPLPVAALPSVSLIPSAPFTNLHQLIAVIVLNIRDNSCNSCLSPWLVIIRAIRVFMPEAQK